MGVPMPEISAQIATWVELVGGILIVLGLLVLCGPIIFIQMLGAAIFAHRSHGVFVGDGGWELVGVIGAAGLLLAASGAGAFSLDHLFMAPFRARRARKQQEHEQEMVASTPSLNNHLHQGLTRFQPTRLQSTSPCQPSSNQPAPASQAPISQTPNNQPTPQKRGIGQFDKPDSLAHQMATTPPRRFSPKHLTFPIIVYYLVTYSSTKKPAWSRHRSSDHH